MRYCPSPAPFRLITIYSSLIIITMNKMKPHELAEYLAYCIERGYPVLVTGKPGIGKTDVIASAALAAKADLIISHPVVSDPTDYKGLPFPNKEATAADFLPYGDLRKLLTAKKKTVFFMDDFGQAPHAVQAAIMQLLLLREINGQKISDKIVFILATNRREDNAGVAGILDPIKSRCMSIIEMQVDHEDWVKWAIVNNMPVELIAFVRWMPKIIEDDYPATKKIENTPSPRTITHVGTQQVNKLAEKFYPSVFAGAAGPAFGTQYCAFLDNYKQLPSLDDIIKDPVNIALPANISMQYAITGGLAKRMTDNNIDAIVQFLDRLKPELSAACMTDAQTRNPKICENRAYAIWAQKIHTHII